MNSDSYFLLDNIEILYSKKNFSIKETAKYLNETEIKIQVLINKFNIKKYREVPQKIKVKNPVQDEGCACYVYIIYIRKFDLFKIGISNNISRRLTEIHTPRRDIEILFIEGFESEREARKKERDYHLACCKYYCNTKLLKSGNDETFKI